MSIITEVQTQAAATLEAQIEALRTQYAEETPALLHGRAVQLLQEKKADLIGRQHELAALEAEVAADEAEISLAYPLPTPPEAPVQG